MKRPAAAAALAGHKTLVEGQVAGTWNLTVKEGASVDLCDSLGPTARKRLNELLEEASTLLS